MRFEQDWGWGYFRDHLPNDFNCSQLQKGNSDYFRQYGLDIPLAQGSFYAQCSGIPSDRYMTTNLFYNYVIPCLNRFDFRDAYADKNVYSELFPDVKQPRIIVRNMRGRFYGPDIYGEEISIDEAVELVYFKQEDGVFFKPTMESNNGSGVGVNLFENITKDEIKKQFVSYDRNFTVQGKILQHPEMARLNPTSLNTMRIITYRTVSGKIICDSQFVRFGGKDSIKDNAATGGGLCVVDKNGKVSDVIYRFKTLEKGSLVMEKGLRDFTIPNHDKLIELSFKLHKRLKYFDYVGWDIGVGIDGEPVFIEFNPRVGCEAPQMMTGPLFGEYMDEVMQRVSKCNYNFKIYCSNRDWYGECKVDEGRGIRLSMKILLPYLLKILPMMVVRTFRRLL